MIGHQYFIDITNILNKLFDALVGIKIDLTSTSITSSNSNLLLLVVFFLGARNEKKKLTCQTIIMDLLNYISTCHSSNLRINFIHECSRSFLDWNPPLNLEQFLKFILVILDNITLCFSHPHRNKLQDHRASWKQNLVCWNLEMGCIFLFQLEKASSSSTHKKEQWLDLLHQ